MKVDWQNLRAKIVHVGNFEALAILEPVNDFVGFGVINHVIKFDQKWNFDFNLFVHLRIGVIIGIDAGNASIGLNRFLLLLACGGHAR